MKAGLKFREEESLDFQENWIYQGISYEWEFIKKEKSLEFE